MINLNQKQEIILRFYRDGCSQRQIARDTGIDRKTIRKYVNQYEDTRQRLLLTSKQANKVEEINLIDDIVEKPKYNSQNRSKRKLSQEVIDKIKFYLEENEQKRHLGQSKQQKKRIDIHAALIKENYYIGYSTVAKAINEILAKKAEAFIRMEYQPGDVCEFDWGEVRVYLQDTLKTFQMAVFTSANGNYRYAVLLPKQKTECFLEAHALFFEHLGGVYRTMVYDNMKVAVKKFVGRNEKEPTEALLKLSLYYGFNFRFCNAYRGNEKGHVERSVEYIRRKAFSQQDKFNSLEEANGYLLSICSQLNANPQKCYNQKTALEILEAERPHLLPRLPKYETARITELRVDKYSTISIDTCRYSVPEEYVNRLITVKIYSEQIICFIQGVKIAEHERKYGANQWTIKIEHYLKTLKKKPGALPHSVAMKQVDSRLKTIYQKYYIRKERDFVELIYLCLEKDLEQVEEAIELLEKINPIDINTEKIKAICNREHKRLISHQISDIVAMSKEHLKMYDKMVPYSDVSFKEEVAMA